MYEVLLEKQAERDLRKLPVDTFKRIINIQREYYPGYQRIR